jgi:hypothetical protein
METQETHCTAVGIGTLHKLVVVTFVRGIQVKLEGKSSYQGADWLWYVRSVRR